MSEILSSVSLPKHASRGLVNLTIGAVSEGDLVLILMAQLCSNAMFRDRLLKHVTESDRADYRVVNLSKNILEPGSGETDLLLVVEGVNGHRTALLIELKLTAAFQSRQAERYAERGERGRSDGKWDEFWTVVVAPQCYLKQSITVDWQRALPIERVAEWMSDDTSAGTIPLIAVLRHATSKSTLGREEDPVAMKFWRLYVDYAEAHCPGLEVEIVPSGRSERRAPNWARFGSRTLRKGSLRISHKGNSSCVDLIVRNCFSSELRAAVGSLLEEGMFISQAGKSAVIRVAVPRISPQEAFDSQLYSIKAIFLAGERLLRFCRFHGPALERLAR
jgi:hypothetical protein